MSKRSGLYPCPKTDTAAATVVSQAGAVLLTETVRTVGLDHALSDRLAQWRRPSAVHDPAKVVLDLAVTLAIGGDCLADIALLRAEPALFGRVASDPTVSRTIDRLAADPVAALGAINGARAAARAHAWALAGDRAPHHGVDAGAPLVSCEPPRSRPTTRCRPWRPGSSGSRASSPATRCTASTSPTTNEPSTSTPS